MPAFTDLQLGLQRTHPFITPEVIRNPLIEQVAEAVLGPRAFLGFVNGNTNCPGSGTQDGDWIYQSEAEAIAAGVSWPHPIVSLVANFRCVCAVAVL